MILVEREEDDALLLPIAVDDRFINRKGS